MGGPSPIELLSRLGDEVDRAAMSAEVAAEIEEAVRAALAMPMADPADALEGVFCEGEPEPLGAGHAPWSGFRGLD